MGKLPGVAFVTFLLSLAIIPILIAPIPTNGQAANGYPARIVAGSCAAPGEVAYALTGLGASASTNGTPVPEVERLGAADAMPLLTSTTVLDGPSITALTDDPYAIVIAASDEVPDQFLACGAIGGILTRQMSGMIMPGDALHVGLGSVDGSGVSGIATLQSVEGGHLQVTILVSEAAS